ncbi:MAG: hypothetical protein ACYTF7_03190 [Planctomycetota bacterium]|jgi:hypothetical protein
MSWLQTLIFILVILGPAAAQIYQKAREKQQIQKIHKRREAMRLEALRTGRPVEEEEPSEGAQPQVNEAVKMQALERDRQARLAALRDQARQRAISNKAQQQTQATASAGAAQSTSRGESIEEIAARRAAEARASRQRASLEQQREQQRQIQRQRELQKQRAQRQQKRRTPQQRPTASPQRQPSGVEGSIRGLTDSQRRHRKEEAQELSRRQARQREAVAHAETQRASAAHVASWLRDRSALKRAIVMSEVLAKPKALRR